MLIEGEFRKWGADLRRFLRESHNNDRCRGSTSLVGPSPSSSPSASSSPGSPSLKEGREEKALLAWLIEEGDRHRATPTPADRRRRWSSDAFFVLDGHGRAAVCLPSPPLDTLCRRAMMMASQTDHLDWAKTY